MAVVCKECKKQTAVYHFKAIFDQPRPNRNTSKRSIDDIIVYEKHSSETLEYMDICPSKDDLICMSCIKQNHKSELFELWCNLE